MIKIFAKTSIQLIMAAGLVFLLRELIDNEAIVIGILVGIVFLVVIYGVVVLNPNPADLLELVCSVEKFQQHIEKHKSKPNIYHLLSAYALIHLGKFEEAKAEYSNVTKTELPDTKNYKFICTVIDLEFAFESKNLDLYKGILLKAMEDKVFQNVNIPINVFKVHQKVLEKDFREAEELAKEVIPTIRKRLFIVELEYLLALSYLEQDKLDDCSAVCEFIIEKNYNVIYTSLCQEMYNKVNRK